MIPASSSDGVGSGARRRVKWILVLVAIVFPCGVVYRVASPSAAPLALSAEKLVEAFKGDQLGSQDDNKLERVLKAAAMEDNTVILTTLNAAWSSPGSVIDLFLESFRNGNGTQELLGHLIIIALDDDAYLRCGLIHPFCFSLVSENVDFSGEKVFMSTDYLAMMWRRIDFLRIILEKGYNFIFTDADIMWFRNPTPHFYPNADFQISCDQYTGNSLNLANQPNGGFLYVKSNNRSLAFYKYWYASREKHPGYHDQDVLNFIKRDRFLEEIGLQIRFLSTKYFGGICQPSRDFSKVCTMHANCCIGLSRKIHDLRVMLEDWRTYISFSSSIRKQHHFTWRVPQNCSLKPIAS